MDPAHASQALSANGAAIHRQNVQEIQQELAALRQAIESVTQQMVNQGNMSPLAASRVAASAATVVPSYDSYAGLLMGTLTVVGASSCNAGWCFPSGRICLPPTNQKRTCLVYCQEER